MKRGRTVGKKEESALLRDNLHGPGCFKSCNAAAEVRRMSLVEIIQYVFPWERRSLSDRNQLSLVVFA